ncbi:MAG: circadian clock protein KaiB [Actinomycetota bacterium]|nr:circadian clock protein KaiB [Actinomycetota bacterium]
MIGRTGAKLKRSEAERARGRAFYDLTLFVSGASALSVHAIADARQVCDIHLDGRYHLAVVDVHGDPTALVGSSVVAVPTLVRNRPPPERKVVGDLSDAARVLLALDIPFAGDGDAT